MKTENEIKERIDNYHEMIHTLIIKRDTSHIDLYQHYQSQIEKKAIKMNLLIWVLTPSKTDKI